MPKRANGGFGTIIQASPYPMLDSTYKALNDFSAGCNFSVLLMACALLFGRRKATRLHQLSALLFCYLAVMNLVLFIQFYVYRIVTTDAPQVVNLYQATAMPFAVLVMHELTHTNRTDMRFAVCHTVPFFLALGAFLITHSQGLYLFALTGALTYGVASIIRTTFDVRRYNRQLVQWASYTEGIELKWLGKIVWGFLGLLVVWAIATLTGAVWMNAVYNLSVCFIFIGLAFCLSRQQVADFTSLNLAAIEEAKAEREQKGDEETRYPFEEAFRQAFDVDHIYLDTQLTILKLAMKLGTNRTYVSNYINSELHCTFFTYVNRRRVAHAKRLLKEVDCPLERIAEMSGFNSISSFRRAFQAYEGMAPGVYRTQCLEGTVSDGGQ